MSVYVGFVCVRECEFVIYSIWWLCVRHVRLASQSCVSNECVSGFVCRVCECVFFFICRLCCRFMTVLCVCVWVNIMSVGVSVACASV